MLKRFTHKRGQEYFVDIIQKSNKGDFEAYLGPKLLCSSAGLRVTFGGNKISAMDRDRFIVRSLEVYQNQMELVGKPKGKMRRTKKSSGKLYSVGLFTGDLSIAGRALNLEEEEAIGHAFELIRKSKAQGIKYAVVESDPDCARTPDFIFYNKPNGDIVFTSNPRRINAFLKKESNS